MGNIQIQVRMKGKMPGVVESHKLVIYLQEHRERFEQMTLFDACVDVGGALGIYCNSEGLANVLRQMSIKTLRSNHLAVAMKLYNEPQLCILWHSKRKVELTGDVTPREYVKKMMEPPKPKPKKLVQKSLFRLEDQLDAFTKVTKEAIKVGGKNREDIDAVKIVCSDLANTLAHLCDIMQVLPGVTDFDRSEIGSLKLKTARLIKEIT